MEKLPKVSPQSSSPVKSAKKGEHKVQFSDEADLRLRGQKVCGKPPEVPRAPPYSRSSSRLSGSSSISSSSSSTSSSSRFSSSSGGSSSALERSVIRGSDTSGLTSSLDRKRSGSVRSKTSDRFQKSDSSRSLSLDRRRAEGNRRESASPSNSSSERKRRECENRDNQNREKKPKTRPPGTVHSRSHSGEQGRLLTRQKMAQPTIPQGNKGDHASVHSKEDKSTTNIEEKKPRPYFNMEWAEKVKRAASRSPSRPQTNGEPSEREDKENEKVREKGKASSRNQDKKERGRSLKRENRTNKYASTGKHK